jgi:hypothetical protein
MTISRVLVMLLTIDYLEYRKLIMDYLIHRSMYSSYQFFEALNLADLADRGRAARPP